MTDSTVVREFFRNSDLSALVWEEHEKKMECAFNLHTDILNFYIAALKMWGTSMLSLVERAIAMSAAGELARAEEPAKAKEEEPQRKKRGRRRQGGGAAVWDRDVVRQQALKRVQQRARLTPWRTCRECGKPTYMRNSLCQNPQCRLNRRR